MALVAADRFAGAELVTCCSDGFGTLRRVTYMLILGSLLKEPAGFALEDTAADAAQISW